MTLPAIEHAIVDLQHSHRELLRVVDSLKPEDWDRGVPYGEWTVKDLVAHAIGDMSPGWAGFIDAGVLTPEFIVDMGKGYDARTANKDVVEERRRFTREDLRQMLFEAHDEMIAVALTLNESHEAVLNYPVPVGPDYELRVADFLWRGAHDRQHADDIRRALEVDYKPQSLVFIPDIDRRMRRAALAHEMFLRAVYSVADDAWPEQSGSCPGWTFHDILAHVSSNEARRRTRLLSALGEATPSEIDATNDIDAWNAASIAERRGWPMRKLVDEYVLGWHEIRRVLSRFEAKHMQAEVAIGGDETLSVDEFLKRMSLHTLRHGGQLLPASRRVWEQR